MILESGSLLFRQPVPWEDHFSGGYTGLPMNSRGFSLIEVMIAIAIVGLVMGLVGTNFAGLQRIATRYNEQVVFNEQYLIFLLKFEEDYQQAEIKTNIDIGLLDDLTFQIDYNQDGNFDDPGERIAYRWNSSNKRIDRKSGNGSFQAFLDGIARFDWNRTSLSPICYRLKVVSTFNDAEKSIDYCRAVPW
jgi:prepilin-type N-terminal cleavage/methylation domain-containing protein